MLLAKLKKHMKKYFPLKAKSLISASTNENIARAEATGDTNNRLRVRLVSCKRR